MSKNPTIKNLIYILLITGIMSFMESCQPLKESSKYQFSDGYYKVRFNNTSQKIYVLTGSDTIKAYRKADLGKAKIDTFKAILFAFPAQKPANFKDFYFRRNTFDADVLTVLFKYRPSVHDFPPQFNATFNGAVYLGYRTDIYKLSYAASPLHIFKRSITHYGFSAGLFSGLGTARIDEFVTNNAIAIEYDGLISHSGVAFILAVDKLTAGLTFGADQLLDKNKKVWVNNGKPWVGLSLGLNLN